MPNNYFRFKEFVINQDKCAMKVTTDACVLGASANLPLEGNVLDIGTGTGLLALMIAQRTNCYIDAVELDEESFHQASENIAQSNWNDRINMIHSDIRNFISTVKYDFIICNPPFFEKQLKSASAKKNKAKHADNLSLKDLMAAVERLLNQGGQLAILLPEARSENLITSALGQKLFPFKKLSILHSEGLSVMSTIHHFSFQEKKLSDEKLIIMDGNGNHTVEFKKLLSAFYLDL